jgi:hypothetical protein
MMVGDLIAGVAAVASLTDEQAKAVQSISEFGATTLNEGADLARYVGRILGTAPHDAVGIVIGDPLRFVRAAIASQYDALLDEILKRRGVRETQPVGPSVAIPLIRAAYDESRPELQKVWAALIADAMDPNRAGQVRISFIESLKKMDPLDALVLKLRFENSGDLSPSPMSYIMSKADQQQDEVIISIENLKSMNCVFWSDHISKFILTPYGRALGRACSDSD